MMRAAMIRPAVSIAKERGDDIEEEEVQGLLVCVTGQNGGLDSGTVGDGLVRVDSFVRHPAIEGVGDELDDTGGYERSYRRG